MKKMIIGAFIMVLGFQSYAQQVLFEAKLKKEAVPMVVIDAVEDEFPDFEMIEFKAIPIEFIEEDVIVNRNIESDEDYNTYEIALEGKGKKIKATYDKEGKLMSTTEHFTNVTPPAAVRNTLTIAFPGWTISKDSYQMTHYSGKQKKERYNFILEKGKEKKSVFTDAKGNIIKAHKKYI